MITGVAFCPHPPVLVPDVGLGASVELDELRTHAFRLDQVNQALRAVGREGPEETIHASITPWA